MTAILINSVIVGAAAIVAVLITATVAGRAATRFSLWFAALIAVAVLSPLTLFLPPIEQAGSVRSGHLFVDVWLAIAGALLVRTAAMYVRLRRRLGATFVDDERVTAIADEIRRDLDCRRHVRVCLSSAVRSPQFLGLWRPTIAVPEMGEQELRAVLLHEIAHVRRYDDWLLAMEAVAGAVFFFNPSVMFIARRLKFERELSCDEAAVAIMSSTSYAEVLLRIAERTRSALALAATTLLMRRVAALLDRRRPSVHQAVTATVALIAFVTLTWCVTPILIRRPVTPAAPRVAPQLDLADANAEGAEHFVNARSLLDADQYPVAISEFSKSIDLGYEVAASAYNISVAYERMGNRMESKRWRRRADRTVGST